jgi:hypothetical protein
VSGLTEEEPRSAVHGSRAAPTRVTCTRRARRVETTAERGKRVGGASEASEAMNEAWMQ